MSADDMVEKSADTRIKVETLVPFGRHWPRFERLRRIQDAAWSEVATLPKLSFTSEMLSELDVKVHRHESLPEGLEAWTPPVRGVERSYLFWLLESSTTVDLKVARQAWLHWNSDDPEVTEDFLISVAADVIVSNHRKLIGDLIVASNIAKPGALVPERVAQFVAGQFLWSDGPEYLTDLDLVRERAEELGWPTIEELPLASVWTWLSSIDGMSEGVPKSRVGRAVAALSQLLVSAGGGAAMDLMWAMVGLEALYLQHGPGLATQLLSRMEIVLGPIRQNRKVFKRLYDYRSRFVHGDVPFPLAYSPHDAVEAFEKFSIEAYEYELIASAMLLSTLQWLAVRDRHELEFELQLRPPDGNEC